MIDSDVKKYLDEQLNNIKSEIIDIVNSSMFQLTQDLNNTVNTEIRKYIMELKLSAVGGYIDNLDDMIKEI